jgi:MraZ protein
MGFRGLYDHTVDDRGRVAIPARYRQEFLTGVVLTLSPDGCVQVYTPEGFEEKSNREASVPDTAKFGRRSRRRFDAPSYDAELDRQGRILLPARLREGASLQGPVIIAGVRECLEIWNPKSWESELEASMEQAESYPPEQGPEV